MRWFIERGIRQYAEVGPGRVLQGLLKRTDPALECASVGTADDVRAWAQHVSSSGKGGETT